MIRSIIVENEASNSAYLEAMLAKHFDNVDVISIVDNIPEAIERVRELDPDLIFLDIELPPYTGFNLLEETREMKYHTILTTSFNQYAVKAFKFSAVHYLEKPFGLDDMKEAMAIYEQRVGTAIGKESVSALLHNLKEGEDNQVVGFPVVGGIDFIAVNEIIVCKADNNYTELRLTGGRKVLVSKTLKKVELLLNKQTFFRVHNSFVINLDHMKQYRKADGGGVIMKDELEVAVSRNRRDRFLLTLKERGMI